MAKDAWQRMFYVTVLIPKTNIDLISIDFLFPSEEEEFGVWNGVTPRECRWSLWEAQSESRDRDMRVLNFWLDSRSVWMEGRRDTGEFTAGYRYFLWFIVVCCWLQWFIVVCSSFLLFPADHCCLLLFTVVYCCLVLATTLLTCLACCWGLLPVSSAHCHFFCLLFRFSLMSAVA